MARAFFDRFSFVFVERGVSIREPPDEKLLFPSFVLEKEVREISQMANIVFLILES